MSDSTRYYSPPSLPEDFHLSRELQLLLSCSLVASESVDPVLSARTLTLCEGSIDWDAFLGLVDRHHLPAPAYATLKRFAGNRAPEPIMAQLRERNKDARIQALGHMSELMRITRLFAEKNIDVLQLKGPILSIHLYNDPGIRQLHDIDLMVKPRDVDLADQLLTAEGYDRIFPDFDATARQKAAFGLRFHHFIYAHQGRLVRLELHWRMDLWKAEQVRELWEHSRFLEWHGVGFTHLGEAMLLLFLCDHGARHQWFRIKWLGDVAVMMARYRGSKRQHLIELAGHMDLQRPLAQAALLVDWLYGIPPGEHFEALLTREIADLAKCAVRAILGSEEEYGASFCTSWRRERYLMKLRAGLPYSFYLRRMLVEPGMWKQVPLPDWLFWLYCPLRPLVWLIRRYM